MNSRNSIFNSLKRRFIDIYFLLLILLIPFGIVAQCDAPGIPEGMTFEEPGDYRSADALAADCMEWLLAHDLDYCASDRNELNAFVLVWLSGHPDLIVDVKKEAIPFLRHHPELLYPMLHGMAMYLMETPEKERNEINAHVAGLEAVTDAIGKCSDYKKDEELKRLRKDRRKGRLEERVQGWIK